VIGRDGLSTKGIFKPLVPMLRKSFLVEEIAETIGPLIPCRSYQYGVLSDHHEDHGQHLGKSLNRPNGHPGRMKTAALIMTAHLFDSCALADARQHQDNVCVSPLHNSTFFPRIPFGRSKLLE